jgi:catalase (peroxidase I)
MLTKDLAPQWIPNMKISRRYLENPAEFDDACKSLVSKLTHTWDQNLIFGRRSS